MDSELAINKYRVEFWGNSYICEETVKDFALFRSAEIALSKNFDYFVVGYFHWLTYEDVKREMREAAVSRLKYSKEGVALGGALLAGRMSGMFGCSTGFLNDVTPILRLEIELHQGRKPAGDALIFDAKEVREILADNYPELQKILKRSQAFREVEPAFTGTVSLHRLSM